MCRILPHISICFASISRGEDTEFTDKYEIM